MFTVTASIQPEAVVNDLSYTICSREALGAVNPVTFTSTGGTPTNFIVNSLTPAPSALNSLYAGGPILTSLPNTLNQASFNNDAFVNLGAGLSTITYQISPYTINGCVGDPFDMTVNVRPEPVGLDSTYNYCSDAALAIDLQQQINNGGNDVLSSYAWAIAPPVNGPINLATIPANGTATNPPPHILGAINNNGAAAGSVTYTITPTSLFNCVGETFDVTINVNPEPVVNNIAVTSCSDVAIDALLPNDANGPSVATNGYSITAISNTANLIASGGNPGLVSNVNNNILIDDAWHNISNQNQNIIYTIIPTAQNTGCVGDVFTVTASIQPEAVVNDLSYTICSREALGAVNPVTFTSTGGTPTNFIVNSLTPAPSALNSLYAGGPILTSLPNTLNQASFNNDAFVNLGAGLSTITYQISPYTINGCVGDPFDMTVNVRPEPVGLDSTYNYCSDAALAIDLQQQINNGGNDVLSSYAWAIAPPVNGPINLATIPANGTATNPPPHILGAINNNGAAAGSVTYTITPTSLFNCVGETFDVTINVNPEPVVNNISVTSCSDIAINALLPNDANSPSVATNGYSITAISNTANLASTAGNPGLVSNVNNGILLDDAWHNISNQNQNIIYTIIPTAQNTGCIGEAFTVNATIYPEAVVNDLSYTVCSREEIGAVNPINFTATGGTPTNFIVNSLTPAPTALNSLYAGGPILTTLPNTLSQASFNNDAFINLGAGLSTITYEILPYTINGCVGDPFEMTINVRPEPVGLDSTYNYCSDAAFAIDLQQQINNGGNNVLSSYAWAIAPPVNGTLNNLPTNGTAGNPPPHLLGAINNTGANVGSVTYTITPTSLFNCEGETFDVTININPEPVVNSISVTSCSDVPIFNGTLPNDANNSPNVATNGYSITAISNTANLSVVSGNPGLWNDTTNTVLIDDAWHNTSNQDQNIIYTIIPTAQITGCVGDAFTVNAIIHPEAVVNDLSYTVCSREEIGLVNPVNFTATGGTPTNFIVNSLTPAPAALNSLYSGGPILTSLPNTLNQANFNNDAFINLGTSLSTITYEISPYTNNGCLGEPFELTVNVRPEPVGLDSIYTYCSNEAFGIDLQQQINNGGNGLYSNYSWVITPSVNGTLVSSTLPANGGTTNPAPHLTGAIVNFGTSPGDVTYSITPTSTYNCAGEPFDVTIIVNPLPAANDLNISVCSKNDLEFNLPTGSTYSLLSLNYLNNTPLQPINLFTNQPYSILFNDTWELDTNTVGQTPQNVTYELVANNMYNCSSTFDLNVQVNPLPIIDFTVLNTVNCANSPIQFNTISSTSFNYDWDFGDGGFAYTPDPSHIYGANGTYIVELIGTNPISGCTDSITKPVQINYTPNSNFVVSDNTGCELLDVSLYADDENDDWSYEWDFGNGQVSNQPIIAMAQFTTEGCYDLTLIVTTQEGCSDTTTLVDEVCMHDNPQAIFSLDSYELTELDMNVQTFNQSINAQNYFWNFGDGTSTTQTDPNHTFSDATATYTIQLTAYNEFGCFDTTSRNITYQQNLQVYVPNTFTPNFDEYNQEFLPVISAGFRPNSYHMTIFDRWGEVVFESRDPNFGWNGTYGSKRCQIGTYTWKINLDALQSGETMEYVGHVNLIR